MPAANSIDRKRSPVFVVGCHRSGTNLLYDMLLSAGGFAIYRGYLPIYKTLIPHFGSMANSASRRKIVETWLRSKGFRRTGLDAQQLSEILVRDCRNGGDFIRTVMDCVARAQGLERWAVYDPDNALRMERVKADIPNSLFVHIIRDGRDIALSLKKMGGFSPLPWDRDNTRSLVATALYWQWMVRRGRNYGRSIAADYIEIHFEDLIMKPHEVLQKLGAFIDHDLDYDRIQKASLGRLSQTNSSFREEGAKADINPLGRWKERLSAAQVAAIEAAVRHGLEENGYALSQPANSASPLGMRSVYPGFLTAKLWLKTKTPMGRFSSLATLELDDEPVRMPQSASS